MVRAHAPALTIAIGILLALLLASCGGGGGGGPGGPLVATIEASPGTVLLSDEGSTEELSAKIFSSDGTELALPVIWRSSDTAVATVDEWGVVTRKGAYGSASITAQAGGVTSNSVVVLAADPVSGAILVSDAQVAGDFAPVSDTAIWGMGFQYTAVLTDIEEPQVGDILVGTGEQPIGGRVVAVSSAGGFVTVTLKLVGLDELFDVLVINEVVDLSKEDFFLA